MTFLDKVRTKAEVGSLIFGYFSAVSYSLIAVCLIGLRTYISTIEYPAHHLKYDKEELNYVLPAEIIIMGAFLYSALALTFSVYLIIGVTKKNPFYIKAYLIFGVVALILHIVALIYTCIMVHTLHSSCCIMFGLIGFGGSVIYSIILTMVYMAYKNLISGLSYDHFENSPKYKEANLPKV